MIKSQNLKKVIFLKSDVDSSGTTPVNIVDRSTITIPKPSWLRNESFDENTWYLIDGNGPTRTEKPILFEAMMPDGKLLTEHPLLLMTIKLCVIFMRNGKDTVRFTDSSVAQVNSTHRLIEIAHWLILNDLYQFSDLTYSHIKRLKKEWVFGTANLLKYFDRYEKRVNEYRFTKTDFPKIYRINSVSKKVNKNTFLTDHPQICNEAGFTLQNWQSTRDEAGHLLRLSVSKEAGGWIKREYRNKKIPENITPTYNKLSATTLAKNYQVLNLLWAIRPYAELYKIDCIKVRPFPDMTFQKESKAKGRPFGRHKTIPEPIALDLIDSCIRWVVYYGPELLDLRDSAMSFFKEKKEKYKEGSTMPVGLTNGFLAEYLPKNTGKAEPWPIIGFKNAVYFTSVGDGPLGDAKYTHQKELYNKIEEERSGKKRQLHSLHTHINHFIPHACAVVILSYCARRRVELDLLRADCIKTINSELFINMYAAKKARKYKNFVTVRVVQMAVELLERWSEDARKISGTDYLFQYKNFDSNEVSDWNWRTAWNEFADYINVNRDENGERWHFTEHQFRRFFSMMYFWRYDVAELHALTQQLDHFDVQMTFDYITETVSGAIFNEEMLRKNREFYDKSNEGKSTLVGPMADQINKEVENIKLLIKRKVNTQPAITFDKWLDQHLEDVGYVLSFKLWGLCFGKTPSRMHLSNCFSDNRLNNGDADFELCKNCANFATHQRLLEKNWENNKPANITMENVCESPLFQNVFNKYC